jgi:hypothetical protein
VNTFTTARVSMPTMAAISAPTAIPPGMRSRTEGAHTSTFFSSGFTTIVEGLMFVLLWLRRAGAW